MAENRAADRVQALSTRLPLPEWPGPVLPIMRFSTRVRPGGSSTSTPLRHAFPPPVTALSPWRRRGYGTACRYLSHRYLHRRRFGVSRRQNCLSEALLISTALPTTTLSRSTRVLSLYLAFARCPCSLLTLHHLNLFVL